MKVSEVIRMTRSLEKDHESYGWPAVRMREMTILADEVERLEKQNAELKQENEYLKKDRDCDVSTLKNLGKEFAKVKKQNKELVELVEEYRRYLILEYKRNSVPRYNPEKSNFFIRLDEKLKKIIG